MEEKDNKKSKVVRCVLVVIAIILGYLFALNGRYKDIDSYVLDSWTGRTTFAADRLVD